MVKSSLKVPKHNGCHVLRHPHATTTSMNIILDSDEENVGCHKFGFAVEATEGEWHVQDESLVQGGDEPSPATTLAIGNTRRAREETTDRTPVSRKDESGRRRKEASAGRGGRRPRRSKSTRHVDESGLRAGDPPSPEPSEERERRGDGRRRRSKGRRSSSRPRRSKSTHLGGSDRERGRGLRAGGASPEAEILLDSKVSPRPPSAKKLGTVSERTNPRSSSFHGRHNDSMSMSTMSCTLSTVNSASNYGFSDHEDPQDDHEDTDDIPSLITNPNEYDEKGRCVRHPWIRLRKKKLFGKGWKVLLSACPNCCANELRRVEAAFQRREGARQVLQRLQETGSVRHEERESRRGSPCPLAPPRGTASRDDGSRETSLYADTRRTTSAAASGIGSRGLGPRSKATSDPCIGWRSDKEQEVQSQNARWEEHEHPFGPSSPVLPRGTASRDGSRGMTNATSSGIGSPVLSPCLSQSDHGTSCKWKATSDPCIGWRSDRERMVPSENAPQDPPQFVRRDDMASRNGSGSPRWDDGPGKERKTASDSSTGWRLDEGGTTPSEDPPQHESRSVRREETSPRDGFQGALLRAERRRTVEIVLRAERRRTADVAPPEVGRRPHGAPPRLSQSNHGPSGPWQAESDPCVGGRSGRGRTSRESETARRDPPKSARPDATAFRNGSPRSPPVAERRGSPSRGDGPSRERKATREPRIASRSDGRRAVRSREARREPSQCARWDDANGRRDENHGQSEESSARRGPGTEARYWGDSSAGEDGRKDGRRRLRKSRSCHGTRKQDPSRDAGHPHRQRPPRSDEYYH